MVRFHRAERRNDRDAVCPSRLHGKRCYGSTLLRFAVKQKGIRKVDVNEQNTRASYFYKNHGFQSQDETTQTPEGMPYPILHLELTEDK